jgi:hypothetical protein
MNFIATSILLADNTQPKNIKKLQRNRKMPVNDSTQPIQFVLFGNVYTYIVKYPKSHYSSFINDLILFGHYLQLEKFDVIKNINHYVLNWWEDRSYEIEIPGMN